MLAGFLVLRARALLALGRPGEALNPAREAAATFEKTEDASGAEEATAQAARALRLSPTVVRAGLARADGLVAGRSLALAELLRARARNPR